MNIKHEDFIGIYEDVYPEGYCNHMIAQFELLKNKGFGFNRMQSEKAPSHIKDDYFMDVNHMHSTSIVDPRVNTYAEYNNLCVIDLFFNGLQKCYDDYLKKYSTLGEFKITASHMKMQKTSSGGGYHVWHAEHGPNEMASRVLVYALYLNTLDKENCGETEFLYQQKRYSPKENCLIIWPAAFTHTHRGNPVYGDVSKYIITGWFHISE